MMDSCHKQSSPITSDSEDSDYSPQTRRFASKIRPKSTSFIALRDAVYQLTCLNDFHKENIGSGFFADVYKVIHKTTGEVMVLKMNKCRKNSKQMLAEIQLMNRLSHPNILQFKGSCVHEGHLHALTEYINGGTLEELLDNTNTPLSWSLRIKLAHDIACGMSYLHHKGIFHRDLTSKNCLIKKGEDGSLTCIVADFGLAAKIKHKRYSYTNSVGSPFWMAPECLHGKNYGEQADVFSYGIILAEIMSRLSADPDFLPRTNKFGVDYENLRGYCEGCPIELWELMVKCSQLDPDDRPTFDEVLLILKRLLIKEDYTSTILSSSQSASCLIVPMQSSFLDDQPDGSPDKSSSPDISLEDQLTSLLEGDPLGPDKSKQHHIVKSASLNSYNSRVGGVERLGGGDSGIDPGVYWKGNMVLTKTPSLNEPQTSSPVTPSFFHFRQISDSSDISFQLPPPSFGWAPPPTPIRHLYTTPLSPISPLRSAFSSGSLSSPEHSPSFRHFKASSSRLVNRFDNKTRYSVVGVSSEMPENHQERYFNGIFLRSCYSSPNLYTC